MSEPDHHAVDFALQAAAVLRLAVWETEGLREYLDALLPTAATAHAALCADRRTKVPDGGYACPNAPLARQVLTTWIEHFAWEAPRELDIDVVLRPPDSFSDTGLEELAEFLWAQRHCDAQAEGGDDGNT